MRHRCKRCGVIFSGELDKQWPNHVALYHSLSPRPTDAETDGYGPLVIETPYHVTMGFEREVWL